MDLARRIGFGYGETSILIGLAQAHLGRGEPHLGRAHVDQALAKIQNTDMRVLEAQVMTVLARCLADLGEPDRAADTAEQALTLARKGNQRLVEARALRVLSDLRDGAGSHRHLPHQDRGPGNPPSGRFPTDLALHSP
ncbi:tetratricopeptide repeat protein [Actinokineospora sp. 24-640]